MFNGHKHIGECIDSVTACISKSNQIEHIVVDDGSTDQTWEEIQKKSGTNLYPFKLEKNMGAAYARNFGVSKTDAELLFCLDADDVIFQNTLEQMSSFLQKNNHDWVYCDFLRVDEKLRYITGQDYYGFEFSSREQLLTSIFCGEHFFQQNCLYTRSLFEKVGGFDESRKHFQDFELFTRFLLAGFMPYYSSGPGYLHRLHDENMSVRNRRQFEPELHKRDVKDLYFILESQINSVLNSKQIQQVKTWLEIS